MLVRYMAAQEREERSQERAAGRGRCGGHGGGISPVRSYAGRVRRPYQQGGQQAHRFRHRYKYGPRGQTSYSSYGIPSNYNQSHSTPGSFSGYDSPRYFGRVSGRYGTPRRNGSPGRYSGTVMTPRNLEPGTPGRYGSPGRYSGRGITPRNLEPSPRQEPSGYFTPRRERGIQGGRSSGRGRQMNYH